MGKIGKIVNVNDTLYEVLGTMSVESSDKKGTEYCKPWGIKISIIYSYIYIRNGRSC